MQSVFIGVVFAMIAIASAFVLLPLWNGARRTAIAVAVMLPVAAMLLYAHVGTPLALDPTLRDAASTVDGWIELGSSRKEQHRYAEAMDAYAKALQLAPNDPGLLVEMAETMALNDPQHRISDDALKLLHHAKDIDPDNQRALWFLGIAAYQRQRYADAAAEWEPLLGLTSEDTRAALRKQIDDARAHAGMPALPAETTVAAGPTLLSVRVDIAPALRAKLAPTDTLFVFARMPGGPPMPLAVKRIPAKDFPLTIALADSDGPMPTMRLSQQQTVDVQARVSHSGDALPQSGDFEATAASATVGAKATVALTIDSIRP